MCKKKTETTKKFLWVLIKLFCQFLTLKIMRDYAGICGIMRSKIFTPVNYSVMISSDIFETADVKNPLPEHIRLTTPHTQRYATSPFLEDLSMVPRCQEPRKSQGQFSYGFFGGISACFLSNFCIFVIFVPFLSNVLCVQKLPALGKCLIAICKNVDAFGKKNYHLQKVFAHEARDRPRCQAGMAPSQVHSHISFIHICIYTRIIWNKKLAA